MIQIQTLDKEPYIHYTSQALSLGNQIPKRVNCILN